MPDSSVRHPLFARLYAWASPKMENVYATHRHALLAGLTGTVIEVGAGNGLNFAHYPPQVTSVFAVEPEPHLRQVATRNATKAPIPVTVVDGLAQRLPADDRSFDAAVVSLVLCSVPDQAAALAEIRRVLTDQGKLRFLEHVQAGTPTLRRVQKLLDATVWPRLTGGCHPNRDTAAAITRAGFGIDSLERLRIPDGRLSAPTTPHILGTAHPRT